METSPGFVLYPCGPGKLDQDFWRPVKTVGRLTAEITPQNLKYRTTTAHSGVWILQGVDDVADSCWNRYTHAYSKLTAATRVLLLLYYCDCILLLKNISTQAQRTITYIPGHGHPPPSRHGTNWPALVVLFRFSQPNDHMATHHRYLYPSWVSYEQPHSSPFPPAQYVDIHTHFLGPVTILSQ